VENKKCDCCNSTKGLELEEKSPDIYFCEDCRKSVNTICDIIGLVFARGIERKSNEKTYKMD
jgi:hypothetical protein